jgi:hypothetical protein
MPHQSIRHSILRSAIFASALSVAMTGAANAANLALTHAHIVTAPDAIPIEDGTILIHDGRIAAVVGITRTSRYTSHRTRVLPIALARRELSGSVAYAMVNVGSATLLAAASPENLLSCCKQPCKKLEIQTRTPMFLST